MKKIIFIALVLLMASFAYAAYTGHVYSRESQIVIAYYNNGNTKIKNARASAYFPDFDSFYKSGSFNIRAKDSGRAYLRADISNAKPGYYAVVARLYNNNVREKKHSWVYIEN